MLCDNKAPRIKRQVASIDKKSDFRAKSSHFRTSTPNVASSSQKKQTTPKTVTSGKVHVPSPRMHSFKDAKIQGGKRATGVRPGRDVDVSDSDRIKLSRLVQDLLHFAVLGSLWLWGGDRWVGSVWGHGGVCTCMHTCAYIHV